MKVFIFCLSIISCVFLDAQTYKVPEGLFKILKADVNYSEGDFLYKSQSSGYYTGGGGLVVRSPIKDVKLMNISLPHFNGGCGGIDMQLGGFSFISGEQLVESLEAIASNSAGFAFMLGVESVTPSAASTIRQLKSWANTINGIGINSCEMAAGLVGSVWPANDIASQHICKTVGTSNFLFTDHIESRHQCSKKEEQRARNQEVKDQISLVGDYNLVWEALMTLPIFQNEKNRSLAEIYMTFVGTLVVKDDEILPYPSKADCNEFLQSLLEGGMITTYKCLDKSCLNISETIQEVSLVDAWNFKIFNLLKDIQEKGVMDEPLNNSEKEFLLTTRLPVLKFINVLNAFYRGKPSTVDIEQISKIISWDVLVQIINESLKNVRRGCKQMREKTMYGSQIDEYLRDLDRIQKIVYRYEEHIRRGIDLEMRLIQKMQLLEKQVNSEIMTY